MTLSNIDTCSICQVNRATGIGLSAKPPHQWVCVECSLLIEDIRRIKRMDAYEHAALGRTDEIAGDYCADHGTDIAQMDELARRMLWKTVVQGYGNALRDAIREGVPF